MTKNEWWIGSCYLVWLRLFYFLLCFEWNCFPFFLARFFLLICCCWFLWNFVSTVETSWRHWRNARSLNMCQLFLRLGWNSFSPKFARIGSVSLWIKIKRKKKTKQLGKQSADPSTVLPDLHGNESSPLSFPWLLYTPNVHLTPTKRKRLSSQALINTARHFPFTCIGSTNLNIF